LAPLYAMRYGAVPIVRQVGGLLDNVVAVTDDTIRNETATGFTFQNASASALLDCVDRALAAYAQPSIWRTIQRQAMVHDSSWTASAREYLSLYRGLIRKVGFNKADLDGCFLMAPAERTRRLRRMHGIDRRD